MDSMECNKGIKSVFRLEIKFNTWVLPRLFNGLPNKSCFRLIKTHFNISLGLLKLNLLYINGDINKPSILYPITSLNSWFKTVPLISRLEN